MAVAQTISSDVIEVLNSYKTNKIDDFTFMSLKRDIDKVEVYTEKYMLLGMLYVLKGDVEKVIDYFNKSLNLCTDMTVCTNYVVALERLFKLSLAKEETYKYAATSTHTDLITQALFFADAFGETDQVHFFMDKVIRYKLEGIDLEHFIRNRAVIKEFGDKYNITPDKFSDYSHAVMDAAEKSKACLNLSIIEIDPDDRERLIFKYYVDSESTVADLSNFNEALTFALIEKDLDLLPITPLVLKRSVKEVH